MGLLTLMGSVVFAAGAGESDGAGTGPGNPDANAPTTITVVGAGSVVGVPDTAVLSVGVEVSGESPEQVLAVLRARSASIQEALKARGIPERSLQTTHYNVRTERDRPAPQASAPQESGADAAQPEIRYVGTTGLRIDVANIDDLDEIMTTATDAGATEIWGLSFAVSKAAALHDEARLAALEDARRKAEEIAAAQGLEITGIRSISTQQQPSPRLFESVQTVGRGGGGISPGELDFQEAVTVVYTAR
jgi:hypothetical protein